MLTAQPRFSGNGGHGKRLLETEEVSKLGGPGMTKVSGAGSIPGRAKLQGAARQAEQASFKMPQPMKPMAVKKPKVYNVGKPNPAALASFGKGANKDIEMTLQGHKQYKRGKLTEAGGFLSGGAAAYKWGMQSGGGAPRGKAFWALAGAAPALVAGGRAQTNNGRKRTRQGLANLRQSQAVHSVADRLRASGQDVKVNPKHGVSKKARTYDSELNRQRRQGMYTAAGAVGGGGLVVAGGRDLRSANDAGRQLRSRFGRLEDPATTLGQRDLEGRTNVKTRKTTWRQVGPTRNHLGGKTLTPAEKSAFEELDSLRGKFSRKAVGRLGAGATLLAGSAGMYKHSRSSANRRWN